MTRIGRDTHDLALITLFIKKPRSSQLAAVRLCHFSFGWDLEIFSTFFHRLRVISDPSKSTTSYEPDHNLCIRFDLVDLIVTWCLTCMHRLLNGHLCRYGFVVRLIVRLIFELTHVLFSLHSSLSRSPAFLFPLFSVLVGLLISAFNRANCLLNCLSAVTTYRRKSDSTEKKDYNKDKREWAAYLQLLLCACVWWVLI